MTTPSASLAGTVLAGLRKTGPRVCTVCGSAFTGRAAGRQALYCTPRCARRARYLRRLKTKEGETKR